MENSRPTFCLGIRAATTYMRAQEVEQKIVLSRLRVITAVFDRSGDTETTGFVPNDCMRRHRGTRENYFTVCKYVGIEI